VLAELNMWKPTPGVSAGLVMLLGFLGFARNRLEGCSFIGVVDGARLVTLSHRGTESVQFATLSLYTPLNGFPAAPSAFFVVRY
jgi:hypothetical protein